MEDDDAANSRSRLPLNNIASLLYCHEDPLVASTPPPPPPPPADDEDAGDSTSRCPPSSVAVAAGDEEEDLINDTEMLLLDHMARQRCYAPTRGYLEHLQQQQGSSSPISRHGVSAARSRGVHYIINVFGRLGLAAATPFNAVNYLDRFLSINRHLRWEAWMVELVSVACLSIACKLDEVHIPSLHHLQIEEAMSHSFLPSTVRDMELTLLKALQWRLACVTPYSFLQLLSTSVAAAAYYRCTRLLIRSLAEPSLIQFDPSVIASSALRCVALEEDHHQAAASISCCNVSRLLDRPADCPTLDNNGADECFRMMQTLYASSSDLNTHQSPISVISSETGGGASRVLNRSAVSRRRLFCASSTPKGSTQVTGRHL